MQSRPRQRMAQLLRTAAIPSGLFGLALLIRLWYAVGWDFDGLYGQDSYAYFNQARAIYLGASQGLGPPRDFFWPNGFPGLVALGMLIGGVTPLAAQMINLIFGAFLAPLLYWLSCEIFSNRTAALIAGLMAATASQLILSSIVIMSDTAALVWAVLAVWMSVRAANSPRPLWWLIGLGLTLSLAMITRWMYGILIPVIGVYVLRQRWEFDQPWRALLVPIASGAPLIILQILLSLGRPEGMAHSWLLNWNPINGLRRSFSTVEGHTAYALPNAIFYAQPLFHPSYVLPPLGMLALWGAWRCLKHGKSNELLLLGGWFGLAYGFLAGIPNQNFRLGMAFVPPIALLAGFGWSQIAAISQRRWVNGGLGLLMSLAMLAWSYRPIARFIDQHQHDKTIARNTASMLPADARVVSFGLTLTLSHYTDLQIIELYALKPEQLEQWLCDDHVYVLVNPTVIETQWHGSSMHTTYRWIQSQPVIEQIDGFSPYTLIRVGGKRIHGLERSACESR